MNDGGPAFPTEHMDTGYESKPYMPSPGMSLRDWFAGMALSQLAGNCGEWSFDPEDVARYAFEIANAMLKQQELR